MIRCRQKNSGRNLSRDRLQAGKNGIMIGQAYSYSEDGKSVDLYTIRQSEYEKLTGEKQIFTTARSLPGIRLKRKKTY